MCEYKGLILHLNWTLFWDPPIFAGTKVVCTSIFIWIRGGLWKRISWQALPHFMLAQKLGQPWNVQSGLVPEGLPWELPSQLGTHPTAQPWHLETTVATAGESWQNWVCFPSKALLCLLWAELSPGEPRRGCGQLWASLSRGEGQTWTLPDSLHQCSTDSMDISGTDTHRLLQVRLQILLLQISSLLDGTGLV